MSEVDTAASEDEREALTQSPSDAFGLLSDENRIAVLRELSRADERLAFSDLFEAAPAEKSAGFAYHLRRIVGTYVEKTDDGYDLTPTGQRVARVVRAGAHADGPDFTGVDLEAPCPHCEREALEAESEAGEVTIACSACDRPVLALPLPPGGRDRSPEDLVATLDRHHRHRLSTMADGTCPECGGPVTTGVEPREIDGEGGESWTNRPRASLDCESCGWHLRCPVTLAVLDHPAVVSFYHDHGEDVTDRPLWNVGEEWRERVLSTDPICVRVASRLDGEALELLVGRDLTVVETRRSKID